MFIPLIETAAVLLAIACVCAIAVVIEGGRR